MLRWSHECHSAALSLQQLQPQSPAKNLRSPAIQALIPKIGLEISGPDLKPNDPAPVLGPAPRFPTPKSWDPFPKLGDQLAQKPSGNIQHPVTRSRLTALKSRDPSPCKDYVDKPRQGSGSRPRGLAFQHQARIQPQRLGIQPRNSWIQPQRDPSLKTLAGSNTKAPSWSSAPKPGSFPKVSGSSSKVPRSSPAARVVQKCSTKSCPRVMEQSCF